MDTRHILVTTLLLLCLCTRADCKQNKRRNKINCKPDDERCKAVQLTCPKGSIIYNPDVFADSAGCEAQIKCRGLTPNLLAERNNCFWKNTCIIQFPKQIIVTVQACRKLTVACLRVLDWKCLPTQGAAKGFYMTDICDNGNKSIGGSTLDRGIIRSHKIMPWTYDSDLFSNGTDCLRTLYPTAEQSVVLTIDGSNDVINNAIDVEKDVGYITDGEVTYNITDKVGKTVSFRTGKAVSIHFGTTGNQEHYDKGGSGFIICFKFTDKRIYLSKSVCNDIYVGDKKTREFKRKKKSKRCDDVSCKKRKKPKKSARRKTKGRDRTQRQQRRRGKNRRKQIQKD